MDLVVNLGPPSCLSFRTLLLLVLLPLVINTFTRDKEEQAKNKNPPFDARQGYEGKATVEPPS